MRFLNNLPITIKTLISPVISALILIAIVGQFVFGYQENQRAMDAVKRASHHAQAVNNAAMEFNLGYNALIKAVSWKVANVDAATIKKAADGMRVALAHAETTLNGLDFKELPEAEKMLGNSLKNLAIYKKRADETIELADMDGFVATMSLNDDEEMAQQMLAEFRSLVDYMNRSEADAANRAEASLSDSFQNMLTGAGVSIPFSLLVALLFARIVARPVRRLTAVMTELAAGRTDVEVPASDRTDEIGAMCRSVAFFKAQLDEKARMEAERRAAEERTQAERREIMLRMARQLDASVGDVLRGVAESANALSSTASNLTSVTGRTSQTVQSVASAAADADTSVQGVASAAEQLSSSINEITAQAKRSVSVSESAVGELQRAEEAVRELSETATQISAVTDMISGIAAQTNLLALNATIEAARASAAGRGFAVVATEVKTLSGRTAQATKQIAERVEAIRNATANSVAAIEGIKATISEVNGIATSISTSVAQQGVATSEISRNMHMVARATKSVSHDIGDVKTGASTTGGAAANVQSAVEQLRGQAAMMEDKVRGFIAEISAA